MLKLVTFLSKKPGMTDEDFFAYYENHHSRMIELVPGVQHYVRRYVKPLSSKAPSPVDFDVITEMWFEDRPSFKAAMATLAEPTMRRRFAEDEERLFDRAMSRSVLVEEYEG